MPKITILTHGISINLNNYPNNSLKFRIKNVNEIEISDLDGKVLYSAIYTDFIDSNDHQYASAQAVINDLRNSYS